MRRPKQDRWFALRFDKYYRSPEFEAWIMTRGIPPAEFRYWHSRSQLKAMRVGPGTAELWRKVYDAKREWPNFCQSRWQAEEERLEAARNRTSLRKWRRTVQQWISQEMQQVMGL